MDSCGHTQRGNCEQCALDTSVAFGRWVMEQAARLAESKSPATLAQLIAGDIRKAAALLQSEIKDDGSCQVKFGGGIPLK